jgi:thiol-disulfide isomerase/thioredoxin
MRRVADLRFGQLTRKFKDALMKKLLMSLAMVVLGVAASQARELGVAAPPLQISQWVKGTPVDLAASRGEKIVVVEFWATWCAPCRTSIPHLTALQKKFKDVIIVGISDETPEVVRKFVTQMGEEMDYVVAVDDRRQTSESYLGAFGVRGIPHAFVVDQQGRIVWRGHPMDGLERVVAAISAGTFDLEQERQRIAAQAKLTRFYNLVSAGKDEAQIEALGRELEAQDAALGGIQPGEKFEAAAVRRLFKFQRLMEDYQQAIRTGQDAATLTRLQELLQDSAPTDFSMATFLERMRLNQIFLNYYYAAAGERGEDRLAEYTAALANLSTTNHQALNQYAWTMLTDPKLPKRDLELAAKLAQAGVAASEGKVAAVLDTHARALFELGKVSEAIAEQKRALAVAASEEEIRVVTAALRRYEAAVSR